MSYYVVASANGYWRCGHDLADTRKRAHTREYDYLIYEFANKDDFNTVDALGRIWWKTEPVSVKLVESGKTRKLDREEW